MSLLEEAKPMQSHLNHRKWMEFLLNSLPNAIFVLSLETGLVIYANRKAVSYLHLNPSNDIVANAKIVNEHRWKQGFIDSQGQPLQTDLLPFAKITHGETFYNYEVKWKDEVTNQIFSFLASGGSLPPGHGVVVFVDVTDRVAQREQLKHAISLREDFLSVAAHELKTPITSILLQSQSLAQKLINNKNINNDELVKRLNTISKAAAKLNNLINELLDISRISSPKALQIKELDFCDVLRECILRQELLAKRQNIQIKAYIPINPIRGCWDAGKLEQIISNLISNALKYGNGKPVEINLMQQDGCVLLTVRDHGIGIPPQDRKRIFQRFERAVPSSQYAGMGIGLWLASEAAQAMSGSIRVADPKEGKGSVFSLILPLEGVEECPEDHDVHQETSSTTH